MCDFINISYPCISASLENENDHLEMTKREQKLSQWYVETDGYVLEPRGAIAFFANAYKEIQWTYSYQV